MYFLVIFISINQTIFDESVFCLKMSPYRAWCVKWRGHHSHFKGLYFAVEGSVVVWMTGSNDAEICKTQENIMKRCWVPKRFELCDGRINRVRQILLNNQIFRECIFFPKTQILGQSPFIVRLGQCSAVHFASSSFYRRCS